MDQRICNENHAYFDELEKEFLGNFDEFDAQLPCSPLTCDEEQLLGYDISTRREEDCVPTIREIALEEDDVEPLVCSETDSTWLNNSNEGENLLRRADSSSYSNVYVDPPASPERSQPLDGPGASRVPVGIEGVVADTVTSPLSSRQDPTADAERFSIASNRYVASEEYDDIYSPCWEVVRNEWQHMSHEKIDKLWQQRLHWMQLDLFADLSVFAGEASYTGGRSETEPHSAASPRLRQLNDVLGQGRSIGDVLTDAIEKRNKQLIGLRLQLHTGVRRLPNGKAKRLKSKKLQGLKSNIVAVQRQISALEEAQRERKRDRALILDEYRRFVEFYAGTAQLQSETSFMDEVERTSQEIAFYNCHYKTHVWLGKKSARVKMYLA